MSRIVYKLTFPSTWGDDDQSHLEWWITNKIRCSIGYDYREHYAFCIVSTKKLDIFKVICGELEIELTVLEELP